MHLKNELHAISHRHMSQESIPSGHIFAYIRVNVSNQNNLGTGKFRNSVVQRSDSVIPCYSFPPRNPIFKFNDPMGDLIEPLLDLSDRVLMKSSLNTEHEDQQSNNG